MTFGFEGRLGSGYVEHQLEQIAADRVRLGSPEIRGAPCPIASRPEASNARSGVSALGRPPTVALNLQD